MASISRLPSGKFRTQVRVGGQYRGRSFTTKREAQDWAREIETQLRQRASSGVIQPSASVMLKSAVEAYLVAVQIKPANQLSLKAFARDVGPIALRDLNSATLQRWIDKRLKTVKGQTVANNLGLLTGLLKWLRYTKHIAVDTELPKHARASLSAAKIQTSPQERDRYITDAEIELMRATFAAQSKLKMPMADLMDFALATSMRLGEILRITYEDLAHNERTILVRDRKDPKRKEGNHMRVPLSSKAIAIIERQPTTKGRIFPFTLNSVSSAWIMARHIAGIDNVTFHDLRHRGITDLFDRGLSIPEVSLISGHKTWSILRRYVQLQPHTLVDRLG